MTETTKSLLLRLERGMAEQLAALAEVEGQSVSAVVREAIAEHVGRRRRDPGFQASLRAHVDRNRQLLELLAEDER